MNSKSFEHIISARLENAKQSNPMLRRTVNRFYSTYNIRKEYFSNALSNINAIDLIEKFQLIVKDCNSTALLYRKFHQFALENFNAEFSSIALAKDSYLDMYLLDNKGGNYSSKILYAKTKNPLIKSFQQEKKLKEKKLDFLKIPFSRTKLAMILPLVLQGDCKGVLTVGLSVDNPEIERVMDFVANYFALFVENCELKEKSQKHYNIDTLTGLKSHRALKEELYRKVAEIRAKRDFLSVAILDINNMTSINREYGFDKGDEVLKFVADKAKEVVKKNHIVCRYGGDEIAIIMPSTCEDEARVEAQYLRYTLGCASITDVGSVSCSIGIASYPKDTTSEDNLLLFAEQAMVMSKNKYLLEGTSEVVCRSDLNFEDDMFLDNFISTLLRNYPGIDANFNFENISSQLSSVANSYDYVFDLANSLTGAIDAKDHYTKGHSNAVSRYAEALARKLELSDEQVKRIKLGAMLHDIGKIGIEESILRKTTQLTDSEWEIMKQHPTIGVEKILEPIEAFKDLIPMVKHHHERWDGGGYPSGLKAEEIPFEARIVAIADSFHALISDRSYRQGLDIDKAIEILKAGAGIQWDKELIREFVMIAPYLTKI